MDIILEVVDSYIGDYAYAWAVPARAELYDFLQTNNSTKGALTAWHYEPATKYFSIIPSQAAYQSAWPRDNVMRQAISLFLITWIFGLLVYFIFATLSYIFVFDKKNMKHPKFLKNQIWLEIQQTSSSMPGMSLLTVPFFLIEVRGYTKLYDTTADGPGLWYDVLQYPFFILFTDFLIYWVHRGLHHPLIYKHLHKRHHKWIMPTPFASHAFHPVDGWAQSVPYHIYPLLFPLGKISSVLLFIIVNFWTITIHDGEYLADNAVVNGAACHGIHHLYFNYNYGQYTTLWDRLGNSYRKPSPEMFQKDKATTKKEWDNQIKEIEKMVIEVEGKDDRTYGAAGMKKNN